MKKALLYIFLALLFCSFDGAELKFIQPVKHAMRLSGTYGELRSNHFHSGIDIKSSNGGVGDPVLSIKDGFLSRIVRKPGGYGNALYIDHPDGTTSVYAHLHKFSDEIERYVKERQYELEKAVVDLYPSSTDFIFQAGDVIGQLGNSGRSSGPHLHFEIRDTKTEIPVNPLLRGIKFGDKTKPQIRQVKLDFLDADHRSFYQKKYNRGSIANDTIYCGAWRVGVQVKAYDLMNNGANLNGIFGAELFVDDEPSFSFELDSVSFDETRYLNAHLDFPDRIENKSFFHRCKKLEGNLLKVYQEENEAGVIKLFEKKARKVIVKAYDAAGNVSEVTFWLKRSKEMKTPSFSPYSYSWPVEEAQIVRVGDAVFDFPSYCFYEDPRIQYDLLLDESDGIYSFSHSIHQENEPIHKYFSVGFNPDQLPDQLLNKAMVAVCDEEGSQWVSLGGQIKEGKISTMARQFGVFAVLIDTIAPAIKPLSYRENMKGRSIMKFSVSDNMPVSGKTKGPSFRAEVDGKWILFEQDKAGNWIHRFDGRISAGEHKLRILSTDDRGNKAEWNSVFTR